MYLVDNEPSKILSILRCCRVNPVDAKTFLGSMIHYERHHGSKSLVEYFEYLKSMILSSPKHHLPPKAGNNIVRILNKAVRRHVKYALRILEIVGRWKSKKLTQREINKFVARVEATPRVRKLNRWFGLTLEDESTLDSAVSTCRIHFAPLRSNSTHILMDGRKSNGPAPMNDECQAMAMAGEIYLRYEDFIKDVFTLNEDGAGLNHFYALLHRDGRKQVKVGNISALNKDGYLKHRFVANLVKGWQVAISPCVDVYKQYLKVQPESALFDQKGAAKWAANELLLGKNVSSVDLSKATDNLPRYIFYALMDDYVLRNAHKTKKHALFLISYLIDRDLCDFGYYETPDGRFIQYKTGQAMGRWTSKYQLDLTMIFLARSVGGNASNFRVNGDDIVFSSNRVAKRFVRLLKKLGVPISPWKTYLYRDFGEFSGRIFTKIDGILSVYKGRASKFIQDPFGYLRQYGKAGLQLVPKNFRKKVKVVAQLLQDEDLRDFNESVTPINIDIEELSKVPILEKQEWSADWVQQAFSELAENLVRSEALTIPTPMGLIPINSCPVNQQDMPKSELDTLVELRQQAIYKDSAVERFAEPNMRLNLLVDFLNSSFVKTSDGHIIDGYGRGEVGEIVNRLRREVRLAESSHDKEEKRDGNPTYIKYVESIYKNYRRYVERYGNPNVGRQRS